VRMVFKVTRRVANFSATILRRTQYRTTLRGASQLSGPGPTRMILSVVLLLSTDLSTMVLTD